MLSGYQLNVKIFPFLFVTPLVTPIWPPLATIKAYCEVHKIVYSLVIFTFKIVEEKHISCILNLDFGSLE